MKHSLVCKKFREKGNKLKRSERQRGHLTRCLGVLRKRDGAFTCKRLMEEAGIEERKVSTRTITRYLNSARYFYLETRKKGLMTEDDHRKRVRFAKDMRKTSEQMFGKKKLLSTWTQHPLHIREILSIKLLRLEQEYGEKKRGSGSWMCYKRSEGGNWRKGAKTSSGYILWQRSNLLWALWTHDRWQLRNICWSTLLSIVSVSWQR